MMTAGTRQPAGPACASTRSTASRLPRQVSPTGTALSRGRARNAPPSGVKAGRHCILLPRNRPRAIAALEKPKRDGQASTRAPEAPFDPPKTVGDVLKLRGERRLRQVSGLGRRRIGEIEVGLVYAGFSAVRSPSRSPEPG
jgi:hypothetical protein